jgi:hypothetical protein
VIILVHRENKEIFREIIAVDRANKEVAQLNETRRPRRDNAARGDKCGATVCSCPTASTGMKLGLST